MILHLCPCGGQVEAGGAAPPGGGECLACGRMFESGAAVLAAGGRAAFICQRGRHRRRAVPCSVEGCANDMVARCDHLLGPRRTCDKAMCSAHRTMVGKNRDRCPAHAPKPEVARAP